MAVGYTFEDLGPVPGELDIRGIATFRDKHIYQTTVDSTPTDFVGEVGLNDEIARLNFLWTTDDWLVSLQTNYYSEGMDDVTQAPCSYHLQEVDSYTYIDMQVRYDLTDSVDVYFGIDNLTNKIHHTALIVKMNQTLVLITQLSLMLEFGIVNSITLDLDGICNLDKKKKAGKLSAFFLFFYNRYHENLFNYFYCCFLSCMFRVC